MRKSAYSAVAVILVFLFGCSNGKGNPLAPQPGPKPQQAIETSAQSNSPNLWAYYDLTFDLEKGTIDAVPNRSLLFTLNAVKFLNKNPNCLKFKIKDITWETDYVDIDVDVSLMHPFPGVPQADAYDVRGVFIGNGSGTMKYDPDLKYPVAGTDQILLNADGYTRWYNPSEFLVPSLFGYTKGKLALGKSVPTASLNPYKYFSSGILGPDVASFYDDLWKYLTDEWVLSTGVAGCFENDMYLTRTYLIRMPVPDPGVKYGYAVLASWAGAAPEFHPAHAPEAVGFFTRDNSMLYRVDDSDNGGQLILDIGIYDWSSQIEGSSMTDYKVFLESTVLANPYELTEADLMPIDGGEHWSVYHVDITADEVPSVEGNECWVVVEYPGYDYSNPAGVPNDAQNDTLAAFYRTDLKVIDASVENGWVHAWGGPNGDEARAIATDKDGDIYIAGSIYMDTVNIYLKKFKPSGQIEWSLIWGESDDECCAEGITVDDDKNVYISGNFHGAVDFDPGLGEDWQDTGDVLYSAYLTKFDTNGNYQWTRKWGGAYHPEWGTGLNYGRAVGMDGLGYIYVTGEFEGEDVDFDPGPGIELHSFSNGYVYVSKFDSSGNFIWARNWGASDANGVSGDYLGNVFITGSFFGKDIDFDPGPGEDFHSQAGDLYHDVFLSKFDSNGDFMWANTFGDVYHEEGNGVVCDSMGNAVVAGYYNGDVDFDCGPGTCIVPSKGTDVFLVSYDNVFGHLNWVKTFGGSDGDSARGIGINGSGNIYITGDFNSEDADFDPGPGEDIHGSEGEEDAFVNCFDSLGNQLWARTWGGLSKQSGWAVAASDSDRVYVAGEFYSKYTEFAPIGSPCFEESDKCISMGFADAFIIKFMPDGCW